MATGGFDCHPSYNNRYRSSNSETDYTSGNGRLSNISETLENEMEFGRLSFSDPRFPTKPNIQLSRMMSSESVHSDDVFVESGQADTIYSPRKIEKTDSSASTASILPNPYNNLNHKFHSMIWCTCCFYFVFFCCMPAVRFMEMSDKEYRRGNNKIAYKHGRTASACYILGIFLSIIIYGCILFLVIYFTKYMIP